MFFFSIPTREQCDTAIKSIRERDKLEKDKADTRYQTYLNDCTSLGQIAKPRHDFDLELYNAETARIAATKNPVIKVKTSVF